MDNTKERKRPRGGWLTWFVLALVALVALTVWGVLLYEQADDSLDSDLKPRVVNDITRLNPIQVARVATPTSTEEVVELLRTSTGPVSIGGARCSMGGQTAAPGSLHLDMRKLNKLVSISPAERLVTVQAGMRWRDLQDLIDPHNLAVKIMQTYSTFTVGGTLSVNAHGRYMGQGPVVQSVRAIKLVLASGEVIDASRTENPDVFWAAIGGYGSLGVIVEATLELVPNEKVKRVTETMDTAQYARFFRDHIKRDRNVVFHNGDLHPPNFDSVRAVSWVRTNAQLTDSDRLIPRDDTYSLTPFLINRVGLWPLGSAFRKYLLEPIFYARDVVTWRNHEASYDVRELEPKDRSESTYVLREYFVPVERFDEFVPKLRAIFHKHEVDVVNVSIRYATSDPGTVLAWSRGETFAFVVYYRQDTTAEAISRVEAWSRELVDAVIAAGGTYYLPYQNHATREQFLRAYPRARELFALKKTLDPQLRFQNAMWDLYGPQPHEELQAALAKLEHYHKPEGQTLLTVPEWYLVWNPVEYAAHLRAGHAPDAFPFTRSVREYWSLYKRVVRASHDVYPDNSEYLTMLRVIGVSTTVEYLAKAAYESSLGWLARLTSDGRPSREDAVVASAFTAYSQEIYDKPWYAFEFLPWISKIWDETHVLGPNLIRRTERKLAFTIEFAIKAVYAKLLGFAAHSAYDAPQEQVFVAVEASENDLHIDPRIRIVQSFSDGTHIIAIPRWGPFTQIIPKLAQHNVHFLEIAGNDDIAISVLHRSAGPALQLAGQHMFDSSVVSDPTRKRSVQLVPLQQLSNTLQSLTEKGAELEHLYDY